LNHLTHNLPGRNKDKWLGCCLWQFCNLH